MITFNKVSKNGEPYRFVKVSVVTIDESTIVVKNLKIKVCYESGETFLVMFLKLWHFRFSAINNNNNNTNNYCRENHSNNDNHYHYCSYYNLNNYPK